MIVDQIILAADDARFRSEAVDPFDLSMASGTIGPLADGVALEVTGVALLLERKGIESLLARPSSRTKPLIEIAIVKEMFRGLFSDPYAHRVHTIAGFEDFRRGALTGLQPMEVDGIPTLVSIGDRPESKVSWLSGHYRLPEKTNFSALAWDVASSRQTPSDAFKYSISVQLWDDPRAMGNPDRVLRHMTERTPRDPMFLESSGAGSAFRISFDAQVSMEAGLYERHGALPVSVSLGTPLLRSVHLLEPVSHAYTMMSLLELQVRSREFLIHRGKGGEEPSLLSAVVDLPCHLGRGEKISVRVGGDAFERVEAWLVATRQTRPPVSEA